MIKIFLLKIVIHSKTTLSNKFKYGNQVLKLKQKEPQLFLMNFGSSEDSYLSVKRCQIFVLQLCVIL